MNNCGLEYPRHWALLAALQKNFLERQPSDSSLPLLVKDSLANHHPLLSGSTIQYIDRLSEISSTQSNPFLSSHSEEEGKEKDALSSEMDIPIACFFRIEWKPAYPGRSSVQYVSYEWIHFMLYQPGNRSTLSALKKADRLVQKLVETWAELVQSNDERLCGFRPFQNIQDLLQELQECPFFELPCFSSSSSSSSLLVRTESQQEIEQLLSELGSHQHPNVSRSISIYISETEETKPPLSSVPLSAPNTKPELLIPPDTPGHASSSSSSCLLDGIRDQGALLRHSLSLWVQAGLYVLDVEDHSKEVLQVHLSKDPLMHDLCLFDHLKQECNASFLTNVKTTDFKGQQYAQQTMKQSKVFQSLRNINRQKELNKHPDPDVGAMAYLFEAMELSPKGEGHSKYEDPEKLSQKYKGHPFLLTVYRQLVHFWHLSFNLPRSTKIFEQILFLFLYWRQYDKPWIFSSPILPILPTEGTKGANLATFLTQSMQSSVTQQPLPVELQRMLIRHMVRLGFTIREQHVDCPTGKKIDDMSIFLFQQIVGHFILISANLPFQRSKEKDEFASFLFEPKLRYRDCALFEDLSLRDIDDLIQRFSRVRMSMHQTFHPVFLFLEMADDLLFGCTSSKTCSEALLTKYKHQLKEYVRFVSLANLFPNVNQGFLLNIGKEKTVLARDSGGVDLDKCASLLVLYSCLIHPLLEMKQRARTGFSSSVDASDNLRIAQALKLSLDASKSTLMEMLNQFNVFAQSKYQSTVMKTKNLILQRSYRFIKDLTQYFTQVSHGKEREDDTDKKEEEEEEDKRLRHQYHIHNPPLLIHTLRTLFGLESLYQKNKKRQENSKRKIHSTDFNKEKARPLQRDKVYSSANLANLDVSSSQSSIPVVSVSTSSSSSSSSYACDLQYCSQSCHSSESHYWDLKCSNGCSKLVCMHCIHQKKKELLKKEETFAHFTECFFCLQGWIYSLKEWKQDPSLVIQRWIKKSFKPRGTDTEQEQKQPESIQAERDSNSSEEMVSLSSSSSSITLDQSICFEPPKTFQPSQEEMEHLVSKKCKPLVKKEEESTYEPKKQDTKERPINTLDIKKPGPKREKPCTIRSFELLEQEMRQRDFQLKWSFCQQELRIFLGISCIQDKVATLEGHFLYETNHLMTEKDTGGQIDVFTREHIHIQLSLFVT